jgi:hypothetical protein
LVESVIDKRIRISKERLDICQVCEKFDVEHFKCNECNCLMKLKTLLPWATCPLGKWNSFVNKIDPE